MKIVSFAKALMVSSALLLASSHASAASCFWMSNTAGNPWVASPMPAPNEAACKKLDSCSPDGGKASGGGCYKWANSAEELNKPAAKMACFWMSNTAGNPWVPSPMPAPDQAACKRLDSCAPDGGKASGGGCYVWATEEQVKGENAKKTAPPAPAPAPAPQGKMACFWMSNTAGNPWVPSPMPAPDQAACKRLDSCAPDGGKASGGGCYVWATEDQVKGENAKKTAPPAAAGIKVVQALYGANCKAAKPDVTAHIASACNGKDTCQYKVDHTVIGDPAFGCPKTYDVKYECGAAGAKVASAPPEASGKQVTLDCRK